MNWKPIEEKYGGGESTFWLEYQKSGDKAVIQKLKDSLGAAIQHDGYEYNVKTVNSKDGKTYQFLQRKQLASAPQTSAQDTRAADIAKYHTENLTAWKAQADSNLIIANALVKVAEAVNKQTEAIAEQTAMLDRLGPIWQKIANELEIKRAGGANFQEASEMQ